MKNIYFESIPITLEQQAMVLASPSTWEIINELRFKGVNGLTVEELANRLDIPKSTVYHNLKELRAGGFIESRRSIKKVGRPSNQMNEEEKRTGKQKRLYIEKIPWGSFSFDHNFDRFAVENLDSIIDDSDIFEYYKTLVDQIIKNMKTDSYSKDFLPSKEICPVCKINHEAQEFVWALILLISDRIMKDHEFLVHVQERHGLEIHGYIDKKEKSPSGFQL